MKRDEGKLVYRTTLKSKYGLTEKLIRELGEPDETVKNPHHKSGPPASLFRVDRVESFCKRHLLEIEQANKLRAQRRLAAAKAVKTKTDNLVHIAESVELRFAPLPSLTELKAQASAHAWSRYGANAHEPGYRGLVAAIRHNYSNYDDILRTFRGKVGGGRSVEGSPAYQALRGRLDLESEEYFNRTYPELASESTGTPPHSA